MYLSCLMIELGDNPDRPRPGRKWLRNMYRVHQRLSMAFPSKDRLDNDPDFLKPYDPKDFFEYGASQADEYSGITKGSNQAVHVSRDENGGFLYRVDPRPGSHTAVILVQSALKPNWDYAFHNAGHLLAAPPESKQYVPTVTKADKFRFRLLANPVRKICKKSKERDGTPFNEKWYKKRVPVGHDQLEDWLLKRAGQAGFSLEGDHLSVQPSYVYANKGAKAETGRRYRSALYDGILKVTDSKSFKNAIISGIGPAKAFGFGLLSVRPI